MLVVPFIFERNFPSGIAEPNSDTGLCIIKTSAAALKMKVYIVV
jgi:hypothetical protein